MKVWLPLLYLWALICDEGRKESCGDMLFRFGVMQAAVLRGRQLFVQEQLPLEIVLASFC